MKYEVHRKQLIKFIGKQCPCSLEESKKCICDDFLKKGICRCGLFSRIEDSFSQAEGKSKLLNVAVIGVGAMGKNHARVYSDIDNVYLVAVADTNESNAKNIAKKYGCKSYKDYKEMLENEKLDIVSIVVPTNLHKKVALDVIEKGINVLLEKPIASTIKEGKEIIAFAKKKNVKLMIGHIERFNPAVTELKKRLANNELGNIFKIDINRLGPFPSRISDVGVIIDLAVHDLDILRYLTGSEIKRVHAEAARQIHSSNEDLVKALIRLENDVLCTLSIDWLTPTKIRKLYITGKKGMFVVDYFNQNLYFYENAILNDKKLNYSDIIRGVLEGKMTKFFVNKKEPLLVEIEHFVNCVLGKKEPLVKGEDGLKALELAQMLVRSSEKNTGG
jgi:predicted dehydrogenase